MILRALAVLILLGICPAHAFEVKGITAGMELTQVDLTGCAAIANADSGIPGYRCDTTLGGDKAELRLLVFEEKVVAAIFNVKNALMAPVLDALTSKYGNPSKSNRYIEDYDWRKGRIQMNVKERRLDRGFDVMLIDFSLYNRARAANADKAKKDI